jgi:ribosomal protein S12 methylthiotransferase accessory factor
MTRDEEVLVPFNWFFAINEFNGPCEGNCVEQALSQGICEITERHVSSIVSRNNLSLPAIDLHSVSDPLVLEMLGKYRKAGIKLFANDFSLDTGIPSIGLLAYDPETFPGRSEIVWTAGTTPNPEKALSRALTEVAQLAGDFNTSSNYVASGLPKFRTLEEAKFVMEASGKKDINDLPDLSDENIRVEVENCVEALSRIGLDVIVVDVMHAELQIPAFYTIVPGAHFRERATGTSVGMFSAKLIAENGNREWAISELQKMDALMPEKYYVKFFLGSSYLAVNDLPKALTHFEEALSLDPNEEDMTTIHTYMGVCWKEMGEYGKAITVLEKAEALDEERTDVFNLLGFCHFKLKDHERAIECFRKVLQLDPSSAIDYANIASNYRDMGDEKQAIRYYQFALELDPTIEFARENLRKLQHGASQE